MKQTSLTILLLAFLSGHGLSQVVISEVVTNNTKLEDEDTDEPDWFELHNTGAADVDLEGWHLTTSDTAETVWTLPQLTLPAGTTQLFFASGKNRPTSTVESYRPHTDFSLANEGGYLALLEPSKTVAHSLTYPELGKNVAYGVKGRKEGHLFPASPGGQNTITPTPNGLVPNVQFSHEGGLISGPIELTLEVPDHPDAVIQYSLNGAEPSLFTPTYDGPITIDKGTTVTARATLSDYLPGRLRTHGYMLMDESLSKYAGTGEVFDSNLPIIFIESFGERLDNERAFKPSYVSVISPDPETGRARLDGEADYKGPCGVHQRGESSAGFGQKSYALEIRDSDGEDSDASLLGMPADSDWVIYGPWSEKSLMRNKLIFDWMRELRGDDGTSVRSHFCEVFVNQTDGDTVSYSDYRGICWLIEKIKRGRERVPIEKVNDQTVDTNMITGGYIIRRDKPDSGKNSWNSPSYNQNLQSFDPDRFSDVQLDYVKGYISNFETALKGNDFDHLTKGYRKYIELDTFIDAQWFVEFTKQVDGYVFSTYFHKNRNGKLRAGPLWDFNISLGNASYGTGEQSDGWLYGNRNGHGQNWYPRLHQDPEYNMAHWDRYWEMRHGILSDDALNATMDAHMATLLDGYTAPVGNSEPETVQNPVARHFREYPFLGRVDWPNPAAERRIETWQGEIDYLKEWFMDRLDWIDNQSIVVGDQIHRAPKFSAPAGELDGPIDLEIVPYKGTLFNNHKFPKETIYYTTDGSDPRLPGGALNDNAMIYTDPISVTTTMNFQTRLLNGETWSPKSSGTYLLNHAPASSENLIISEIMYNPSEPSGIEGFSGFSEGYLFEFIEFTNTSETIVDLTGASFSRGIQFDFSSLPAHERLLDPGATILLVKDLEAFQRRHRDVDDALIRGQYLGKLDNGGERLTLEDAAGEEILDIAYNDSDMWPAEADGGGYSLTWAGAADLDRGDPAAWMISLAEGGDPGTHTITEGPNTPDPEADSDRDGLSDFAETLLGSDPQDASSIYLLQIEADGPSTYRLSQRHQADLGDTTLTVEQSQDLITWSPLDAGAPETIAHDDDTVSDVWTIEATSIKLLRIRLTKP
ncbi:MAG: hypothetical protein ACI8T1_003064 [Verrucomicrobiales bacterium]|jgi:hypothetical protein